MVTLYKAPALILLLAAWCAISVPTVPVATAASVGFYAGTFDPPTRSQLRMIHCALGDTLSQRACQELGNSISRLVVVVLKDNEKDVFTSTRERVLMLKRALQRYGDRVEVVASTTTQLEERKQALLNDSSTERLFQIVPGDAYERLKVAPGGGDARVAWLVFPLEGSGGAWTGTSEERPVADSGVTDVVETLGLYREVSPGLADLQQSLFEEGWRDFLNDLKLSCPLVINDKACADVAPRWDAVPVVAADDPEEHRAGRLIYRKSQSEDRWAEKFVKTALQFVQGTENQKKLEIVAYDMAARVLQGYPHGRLPHLRSVSVKEINSSTKNLTVRKKALTCSTLGGSYHADMDQYLADRFPRAFSKFLKEDVPSRSHRPVELYVHNHPLEAAYALHRRDGYSTFHFLQTRRGQLHRNIYLATKAQPHAYRLVLTSVRGADRRANVLCQMQRTGIFANYYAVESSQEQPLFVLNSEGQSLSLNPKDILLFGFKGNWTRRLTARGWQRQPLVKEGLDVDLFTHPTMSHKLAVARNVYGDDGNI
ncbi:MAG: hypothetical protein WCH75_02015, partial [Candidatus Binatia bacterium]